MIIFWQNKFLLINYADQGLRRKKPFSVLQSKNYNMIVKKLWNKYVTKENINKFEILNWENIEKLKKELTIGGFLSEKKVMAILIFAIWCKCFEKYIIKE